jgi:hypothetical protein
MIQYRCGHVRVCQNLDLRLPWPLFVYLRDQEESMLI